MAIAPLAFFLRIRSAIFPDKRAIPAAMMILGIANNNTIHQATPVARADIGPDIAVARKIITVDNSAQFIIGFQANVTVQGTRHLVAGTLEPLVRASFFSFFGSSSV